MNNKKILITMIIGISTLALLTVGATYAFFAVGGTNSFGTSPVNVGAEMEELGSGVTLIKTGSDLALNLSITDMLQTNAGEYTATGSKLASKIAKISVNGKGRYNCSYTMTITKSGTNDLYTNFQNMKTKSAGQIYIEVNKGEEDGKIYDFNTSNLFTNNVITYTGTINGITSSNDRYIKSNLVIVNDAEIDQTLIANSDINLAYKVTSFNCELVGDNTTAPGTILEGEENISDSLVAGLYRYQGSKDEVDNNYICFGTNNATTCKNNPDTYMYRIIGVNEDNQLKVIKMTDLPDAMQWWTDYTTDVPWTSSLIYSNINGSSFLNNTTYVPNDTWKNKIADTNWKHGTMTLEDLGTSYESETFMSDVSAWTGDNMYELENNLNSTVPAKIGLMQVHDFYYQRESGTCVFDDMENGTSSECIDGWLTLLNNDETPSNEYGYEWTTTYHGYFPARGFYLAWNAGSVTGIADPFVGLDFAYGVRPVFYLTSDVTLTGDGTLDNPYTI